MKKPDLPYLAFKTVKGREYVYFRSANQYHRIKAHPGTEEFFIEYWGIRNGSRKKESDFTWNKLIISYYQTPEFKDLAKGTTADYRRHCENMREQNGTNDVRRFRRKHAISMRNALQHTWSKANLRISILSILCKHAVDIEWIENNPVTNITKLKGGEYEAWPGNKLKAYENYCDKNNLSTARIIYELAIGTGQRLGDCCKMKWSDFDGEYMSVIQQKTGTPLTIYTPSRLQDYLVQLPKRGTFILARNLTQHLGKRAVQKSVETVREAIGVAGIGNPDRLVVHGWRYTAVTQLADAGVSDSDIQAVSGHKTLAMIIKYRQKANQKKASKRAQIAR